MMDLLFQRMPSSELRPDGTPLILVILFRLPSGVEPYAAFSRWCRVPSSDLIVKEVDLTTLGEDDIDRPSLSDWTASSTLRLAGKALVIWRLTRVVASVTRDDEDLSPRAGTDDGAPTTLEAYSVCRHLNRHSSSGLTSGMEILLRSSPSIETLFCENRISALCALSVSLPRKMDIFFVRPTGTDERFMVKSTVMVGSCGAGLLDLDEGFRTTASGR